jgi:hypothetical protein
MSKDWTIVTRAKGARFYRPVGGVPEGLDWDGARAVADQVAAVLRPTGDTTTQIWWVPRVASWPEDVDNVLEDSGRRFSIRWDAAPTVTL